MKLETIAIVLDTVNLAVTDRCSAAERMVLGMASCK